MHNWYDVYVCYTLVIVSDIKHQACRIMQCLWIAEHFTKIV